MKRKFEIQKILVPVDFSESSKNTLNHAVALGKKTNAEIHLLHVISLSSNVFPNLGYAELSVQLKERVTEELNSLANELKSTSNLNVSSEVMEGSVSSVIIDVSEKIKCDLILMGTHGISGFEEFFMGSNAYRVVTAAKCPVLTINMSSTKTDYNLIALPIDSTVHSRDKVAEVTTLAKLFGSKVMIAGLITEDHEEERKIFNVKVNQVEEHFRVNGIDFESKMLYGEDLTEMTNSFAQTVGADLIAIMTEQEASTGLFVGPHAQRIVNHSRIPILSITPIETLDLTSGNIRPFHS